jgi:hypothetical protein
MNDYTKMRICLIVIIICGCLSIGISILKLTIKYENKYDVNNDGKVNSQDLFEVKNYIMEKGE